MSTLPINAKLQDGAFTVGKALGQGGFGITYYGTDNKLRRPVAVKEFFPLGCVRQDNNVQSVSRFDSVSYDKAKSNFLEEARALAQFHHPGIVQVYNFFEENNTAYIVMEFLRGKTLAQLVIERGPLPEREAVEFIKKVGEALERVHSAHLLHSDIKPENIIVCDDGRVVLIDFGLTKKIDQTAGLGTRQLSVTTRFGSAGYAPPEQYIQHAHLGAFTDVYALGATLYFLLAAETPVSSTDRLYGVDLENIQRLKPDISRTVADAVMWALQIKEAQRPQKLDGFIRALCGSLLPTLISTASSSPAASNFQVAATHSVTTSQRNHKLDRLCQLYATDSKEVMDAVKAIVGPNSLTSWYHAQATAFLRRMIQLSTTEADGEGWIAKTILDKNTPLSPKTGLAQPLYQVLKHRSLIAESKRHGTLCFRVRATPILKEVMSRRDHARASK